MNGPYIASRASITQGGLKMIRVIVKKRRWLRGEPEVAALYSSNEFYNTKMCCIGFLARRLGATVDDIRGIGSLRSVSTNKRCYTFANKHRATLDQAYTTNDTLGLIDSERMTILGKIGRKMGVNFVFKP
jgi:hypothetical protein